MQLHFIIIYSDVICETHIKLIQMSFQFKKSASVSSLENYYLGRKKGLYDLIGTFECQSLYFIPQNSIVVNEDNITFGPENYTVEIRSQSKDNMLRIIYYSLLYYIFEAKSQEEGKIIYSKMMEHVLKKVNFGSQKLYPNISSEDAKVYFTKFMNLLKTKKDKIKMVVGQLRIIPQMDDLMLEILKLILGEGKLSIEENGKKIEKQLEEKLGFRIQFLTYETFIFQEKYLVEIKELSRHLEFTISVKHQNDLEDIRKKHFRAKQSAHFQDFGFASEPQGQKKQNQVKFLKKKDTIDSVAFEQEESDDEIEKQKENNFQTFKDKELDFLKQNQEEEIKQSLIKIQEEENFSIHKQKNSMKYSEIRFPSTQLNRELPISKSNKAIGQKTANEIRFNYHQQPLLELKPLICQKISPCYKENRSMIFYRESRNGIPKITFNYVNK